MLPAGLKAQLSECEGQLLQVMTALEQAPDDAAMVKLQSDLAVSWWTRSGVRVCDVLVGRRR
jgi:hypothetical protein